MPVGFSPFPVNIASYVGFQQRGFISKSDLSVGADTYKETSFD